MAAKAELDLIIKLQNMAKAAAADIKKDLKGIASAALDVTKQLGGIGGKVLLGGIGAIAGAAIGLGAALRECLGAASEEQEGIARLGAAVTASGANWGTAQTQIEKYLVAELKRIALDDGEGRASLAMLTAQTGSYTEAMKLLPYAADLAKGANVDLATASKLIGKVAEGNVTALTKYGIVLKKGATAQEALAAIQQKFGGQAEAWANTLAGAGAKFSITMGNLKESVGSALLPLATQVGNALAGMLNRPEVLAAIDTFTAALGLLAGGLSKLVSGDVNGFVEGLSLALGKLGLPPGFVEGVTGFADNLVNVVIPAIGGFIGQIVTFVKDHAEAFKGALIGIGAVLAAATIITGIIAVAGAIASLATPVGAIILIAGLLGAAWATNFGGIQEKTKAVIDWIKPYIEDALAAIKGWWDDHGAQVLATVTVLWDGIKHYVAIMINLVKDIISGVMALIKGDWDSVWTSISNITTAMLAIVKNAIDTALSAIATLFGLNKTEIQATVDLMWANISRAVNDAIELVKRVISAGLAALARFWSDHGDEIMRIANNAWTAIKTVVSTTIAVVQGVIQTVMALIKGDWKGAWEAIQGILDTVWKAIEKLIYIAIDNISLALTITWDIIKGAAETIWDSIKETLSGIWDGMQTKVKAVWDAIKTDLETTWNTIKGWATTKFEAAVASIKTAFNIDWGKVGRDVVSGIAKGVTDAAGSIASAAAQAVRDAIQAAKDAILGHSPSILAAIEVGEPISLGMAVGILSQAPAVVTAARDVAVAAVTAASQIVAQGMGNALGALGGLAKGGKGLGPIAEVDAGWLRKQAEYAQDKAALDKQIYDDMTRDAQLAIDKVAEDKATYTAMLQRDALGAIGANAGRPGYIPTAGVGVTVGGGGPGYIPGATTAAGKTSYGGGGGGGGGGASMKKVEDLLTSILADVDLVIGYMGGQPTGLETARRLEWQARMAGAI